tara:strand:+ start:94 stop:627 length:534 start_codon:yes stop_codon:yes gene_type:complete
MAKNRQRKKTDWLLAQGYRMSSLPFKVTWYWIDKNDGKERELITRTDDYNLDLYRRKGFVLDRKYLNPHAWHELEYGVKPPVVDAQQPKHLGRTLRLAKAIKVVVGEQDSWQGTASQLLALIGPGRRGIPMDAASLSTKIMNPRVTAALKLYGISVNRKRTPTKRLLQISNITNITE